MQTHDDVSYCFQHPPAPHCFRIYSSLEPLSDELPQEITSYFKESVKEYHLWL